MSIPAHPGTERILRKVPIRPEAWDPLYLGAERAHMTEEAFAASIIERWAKRQKPKLDTAESKVA